MFEIETYLNQVRRLYTDTLVGQTIIVFIFANWVIKWAGKIKRTIIG